MRWSVAFATAMALTVIGCDETDGSGVATLTGTEWVAETINGKPVIEPGGVTLAFSDERVTGRSGCNRYFGAAKHANGRLKIEQVGATKMACLGDGLMQQENDFLSTLQTVETYAVEADGRLRLQSPSGSVLVFAKGPPPA